MVAKSLRGGSKFGPDYLLILQSDRGLDLSTQTENWIPSSNNALHQLIACLMRNEQARLLRLRACFTASSSVAPIEALSKLYQQHPFSFVLDSGRAVRRIRCIGRRMHSCVWPILARIPLGNPSCPLRCSATSHVAPFLHTRANQIAGRLVSCFR